MNNRLKLTIKNNKGNTVFKLGSSVKKQKEYSDNDISDILQDLTNMIKHELKRDVQKTYKQLEFAF